MPRIHVHADPEMKRRIERAAARWNVPVTQYILEAVLERLEDEEPLAGTMATPVVEHDTEKLLDEMRTLRERILERRGGELINTTEILNELRDERDYELSGLR